MRRISPQEAYLVMLGSEKNDLIVPYYAGRRMLAVSAGDAGDEARLQMAFAGLHAEPLGAVVINGNRVEAGAALARVAALTGGRFQPLFTWKQYAVYLPAEKIMSAVDQLMVEQSSELTIAPESLPPQDRLAGEWKEFGKLWKFQRLAFRDMHPVPARFFSSFGPTVTGIGEGNELWLSVHPVTRLQFDLPPGRHRLRARLMIQPAAFDAALPPSEMTDGVGLQLVAIGADGGRQVLHDRLIDPQHNAADRQPQTVDIPFVLPAGCQLELFFNPGPAGSLNRDWIYVGRVDIK
jgi:hypothetical protein